MRRFNFPLSTLLQVRKYKRDECEFKLGEIESQRRDVEQQRKQLNHEIGDTYSYLREKKSGREVDMNMALRYHNYLRLLNAQTKASDLHMDKLNGKREGAVKELVEANREVRLLERLKEKRREEWKTEVEREEQQFLDEVGVGGYRRQRGGIMGKLLVLIVLIVLAAGGWWAYTKGYFGEQQEIETDTSFLRGGGPAVDTGTLSGEMVFPATREEALKDADKVYDATAGVFHFRDELSKNLQISESLKSIEMQKTRLDEKAAHLEQWERDLKRLESELRIREDDVEKKWKEALAALAENKSMVDARQSATEKNKRESIARLAKSIAKAEPKNALELLTSVPSGDLPDVVKQIPDRNLTEILNALGKRKMRSKDAETDQLTKTIMEILSKPSSP
jgi:flagellar protein FliJ